MPTKLVKTKLGDTLEAFQGDLITAEIERHGLYSRNELAAWGLVFDLIRPGTALDIGANIGHHSAFLARHCARVYAFEPNPPTFAALEGNMARNKLNVQPFNFGISDAAGEFELYLNEGNCGGASFNRSNAQPQAASVTCKVEHGDTVVQGLNLDGLDFIKIDVEGLEGNVVSSLEQSIARFSPMLSVEWNNDATREAFAAGSLFQRIFPGYSYLAVSHDQDKKLCTGAARITRFFKKQILRLDRKPLFIAFDQSRSYDSVLFIPPRFAWIIEKLPLAPGAAAHMQP